jgi:transposase
MSATSNIPVSQVHEMYALHQAGASLDEVGERFGLTAGRVNELFVGEMRTLYERGASLQEIGERFGLTGTHVQRLLNDPPPTPTPHTSKHPIRQMYALYQTGASLREVGEEFGMTGERVGQLLRKAGLKTRSSGETLALARRERVREMYELYRQGASLEGVGKEFGLSASGVQHLLSQERKKLRSRAQRTALQRKLDTRPQEMYELYRQGATLAEVATHFGVSHSRVGQLFAQAGLRTRRPAEHPVQEMYELYELGATLAEVGEEFGLPYKRVFEIFRRAGLKTRSPSQTQALKTQADEDRAQEIVDRFRELNAPRAVAEELEIPLTIVKRILRQQVPKGEYTARVLEGKRPNRFSDEELLSFLRHASTFLLGPLSAEAYRRIAHSHRTPDGRRWATAETFVRRFGGWRKAVLAAGLEANDRLGIAHTRPFTADDCVKAIHDAQRDLGKVPTRAEYAAYAQKSKQSQPSLAVVLRRCGTWTEVLQKAGL